MNSDNLYLNSAEMEQAMVLMLFDEQYLYTLLSISSKSNLQRMVNFTETIHHIDKSEDLGKLLVIEGINVFSVICSDLKTSIFLEWNYQERRRSSGYGDPRCLISDVAEMLQSRCSHFKWYIDNRPWLLIVTVLLSRNLSEIYA